MLPYLIALIAVGFYFYYKREVSNYDYWEKRGFPYIPGKFLLGSFPSFSSLKLPDGPYIYELYKLAGKLPYFGYYSERSHHSLMIKDPEIIRIIFTKEFSHFRDRFKYPMSKEDPLMHYQLFTLIGDKWRAIRVRLTPTFTSGKMKGMFPLFMKCCEGFKNLLQSQMDSNVDVKDLTARFTTDIISSCAFGLEANTMENPDHPLRTIGNSFLSDKKKNYLIIFYNYLYSSYISLIGGFHRFRITPIEYEKYIMKLVADTIEYREKNNVKRNDFMDLIIQLKNKENIGEEIIDGVKEPIEMTPEILAAQCSVFLTAGFETSSSIQSFGLYELALHQDIQQRLREEIEETIEKNGSLTYEAIQEMEYLHMVVSEILRKYPILTALYRVCVEPLTLPAGHKLEKGDSMIIPLWSLHYDPEHFPEPHKFDPERFSKDNEASIKPFTYMPFGEGPRMCIGSRFGLLQTKVGIATVLRNIKVVPCEKTTIPLQFKQTGTNVTALKEPIILKFVPIS